MLWLKRLRSTSAIGGKRQRGWIQTLAWLPFEDRMAWVKAETESIARLVAAGETRMEILMDVIDRELRRQPLIPDFEI